MSGGIPNLTVDDLDQYVHKAKYYARSKSSENTKWFMFLCLAAKDEIAFGYHAGSMVPITLQRSDFQFIPAPDSYSFNEEDYVLFN